MSTQYNVQTQNQGELQSVVDVSFSRNYDEEATNGDITLINQNEVDNLELNEQINITLDSNTVYNGKITKIPDPKRGRTTITVESDYADLFNYNANGRVFYNKDSGKVIEKLITEDFDINDEEVIYDGSSLSNLSSTAPEFELCDFRTLRPEEFGKDLAYVELSEGTSGNITTDIDNISFSGDELVEFNLKLIVNNPRNTYNFKFEYYDGENNYVWNKGSIDGEIDVNLDLSEATTVNSELTTSDRLRITTEISGEIIDDVAYAIDALRAITGDITQRNLDQTVNIDNTGQNITRRIRGDVGESVKNISEENYGNIIVTTDQEVIYKEPQEGTSDISIDGNTSIFDYNIEDNISDITNQIIIEGDNFTIGRREENSVDFYGRVETDRLKDSGIKSQEEAKKKADNTLREKAFRSKNIEIDIGPRNPWSDVEVGDGISVDIPSVIKGEFLVNDISISENDSVNLNIIAKENKIE